MTTTDKGPGFTPGPWVAHKCNVAGTVWDVHASTSSPERGKFIARFQSEDDARACASMPDLYAALEAMYDRATQMPDFFNHDAGVPWGTAQAVRAALARARGQEGGGE